MISRIHFAGALGGFGFILFFFVGFWPLAHFLPGHDPSASADTIAQLYRENANGIRFGMVCLLIGAGCYLMFITALTDFVRSMESETHFLSRLQFAGGTVSSVFLFVPAIFWGITAFRPARADELTLLLNDASWLLLITAVPPFILQTVPIAAAILLCKSSRPLMPRWFAYATVWGDLIYLPGMAAYFFKTGPMAWNGLFPYWLPFFAYGSWILLTAGLMAAIIRERTPQHPHHTLEQPVRSLGAGAH
jgi:hypothetical protein